MPARVVSILASRLRRRVQKALRIERPFWREYPIAGRRFRILDHPWTYGPDLVASEMQRDVYGLTGWQAAAGDVIIDVGANVGLFSIVAAHVHPAARVLAIEPLARNLRYLGQNLDENDAQSVEVHSIALTSDRRELDLAYNEHDGFTATAFAPPGSSAVHQERVQSTTLDDLIAHIEADGGRVAMLKMDCEGAEHEILHASRLLARVQRVGIEIHLNDALRQAGHSYERLEALLAANVRGAVRVVRAPLAERV